VSALAARIRGRRRGGRSRRMTDKPLEHRILLTATLCMLAYGALMVYSASSAKTLLEGSGDGTMYLFRYAIYGVIGLALMHVLARRGLDAAYRYTPVLLGVAFVFLLLVLVPGVGISVGGARRWLGVGELSFQPSEIMKVALVLYSARLLAERPQSLQTVKGIINPLLLVTGAACLLLLMQPKLGDALVIGFTVFAILIAAGANMRAIGVLVGSAAFAVLVVAIAEPYRRARLTAFLNPWADPGGSGYQSVQGQIALGSGGFFGLGPGESVQKVFYLPEAHTDFILAVLAEELGVVGVLALLFLYGLIAYGGLRTARAAQNDYAKLLAAGLTSLILCQAMLNVFAVLGIAPLTGVPLPFISYGSTNLVVLLGAMGLLLNIARGGSATLRVVEGGQRGRARARRASRRVDRGPVPPAGSGSGERVPVTASRARASVADAWRTVQNATPRARRKPRRADGEIRVRRVRKPSPAPPPEHDPRHR
jgi:cell division protein FtsW